MHSGPSVDSLTDVCRHSLLSRDTDQNWDEPMVTVAVNGWCQEHNRNAHPAVSDRAGSFFGGNARIGIRRRGHAVLGRQVSRRQQANAGGDNERSTSPDERRTKRLDRTSIDLAVLPESCKIMIETGV